MPKKYKPKDFLARDIKSRIALILIAIANELADLRQDVCELKKKLKKAG